MKMGWSSAFRALLVVASMLCCVQFGHAAEKDMAPGVGHPITDAVLSDDDANPELARSPFVRKWLQTAEDDAEIRAAFGSKKLWLKLSHAAGDNCRACVVASSLRRVDAQQRRAFLDSGMPLVCNRPLAADAIASIDLDTAYRVIYLGLQAEARRVPMATLTPEETTRVENAFASTVVKLAAEQPAVMETLLDAGRNGVANADNCAMELVLHQALDRVDAPLRDDVLVYLLSGGKSKVAAPERPFDDAETLLDAGFTPAHMPDVLRKQMRTTGTVPFSRLTSRYSLEAKAITKDGAVPFETRVNSQCSTVTGALIRCFDEYTSQNVPYYGLFTLLEAAFPWPMKQQVVVYGDDKASYTEYSVMTDPSRRPARIRPDQQLTFSIWKWRGEDRTAARKLDVSCQTGGRYAASTILTTLNGMAIDMVCTMTDPEKGAERYTMSYVESLRTFVARNYIGPEQQYVVRMGTLSTD